MDVYGLGLTFLVVVIIFILMGFAYLVDMDKLTRRIEKLEKEIEKMVVMPNANREKANTL